MDFHNIVIKEENCYTKIKYIGLCSKTRKTKIMKKSIMIISNNNFFIHAFTMLYSFFENNPYPIDIYLLESDISEKDIQFLDKFISLWPDKRLFPIHLDTQKLEGLYATKELPYEVYFRITGLDFIEKSVNNILAIDLDMTVKGNISHIFETDISNYSLAACRDIYGYVFKNTVKNSIERLGLPTDYTYFNGGFLYFNLDKIRKEGGSEYIMDHIKIIGSENLHWLEQDLLNYVYFDRYLEVDWMTYNCPPVRYIMDNNEVRNGIYRPLTENEISLFDPNVHMDYTQSVYDGASIIHYLGKDKPWQENRPQVETYRIFDEAYLYYSKKAYETLEAMF